MRISICLIITALGLGAQAAAAQDNAKPEQPGQALFRNRSMPYAVFDSLPATRIEVGGSALEVAFVQGDLAVPHSAVLSYISAAARAVANYYGRYPVAMVRILVIPIGGGRIHGTAYGYDGAAIKLSIGKTATEQDLANDWTLTHEMVHLAFPSVPRGHEWIEEGLATYIEPIAREQIGQLNAAKIWGDMVDGMPRGLPAPGDEGLDFTHTWGRTYWGGALFCLLADVEIRRRTNDRHGLQDAMRAVVAAGGNIEKDWPLDRVFEIADKAVGVPVLAEQYARMRAAPVTVDLPFLWRQLGVEVDGAGVTFSEDAPLASVRHAIDAPPPKS